MPLWGFLLIAYENRTGKHRIHAHVRILRRASSTASDRVMAGIVFDGYAEYLICGPSVRVSPMFTITPPSACSHYQPGAVELR